MDYYQLINVNCVCNHTFIATDYTDSGIR